MSSRRLSPAAAILALVVATVALLFTLARSPEPRGRVIEAGLTDSYLGRMAIPFDLDDFYLMRLDDGRFVALYAYVPGPSGHVRGCRIHWEPETTFRGYFAGSGASQVSSSQSTLLEVTGLWVDGCSGSKWDAEGRILFGPAGRDLDRFPVHVAEDGTIRVDARRLRCAGSPCERVWGRQ